MKRPWRGAMPLALTLPLGLERRPRRRAIRLKRLAIGAVIVGLALLAAGIWLPAKAELGRRQSTVGDARDPKTTAQRPPSLAALAIGDELVLERPDGVLQTYEVATLDVVDAGRAELPAESADGTVVLVTPWPFDSAKVGGSWRYVVTARRVHAPANLVAASGGAF